ncbi:hypothetical protein D3C76_1013290 [compost metagenome]
MLVIEKDWFHNERSYNAFVWAAEITHKLEALRKKGALIFDGEDMLSPDGQWIVQLDAEDSFTAFRHGNVTQMYYGGCHDCESGKLWATMKEIKRFYGDIKVVMPQHIITVGKM